MIIGVVGLIGCGKSTVTDVFASLGAEVIDADVIGREVVDSDPVVLYRLVLAFGDTILNRDNTLNRRELGHLAFANADATQTLNKIVHPELLRRLDAKIASARGRKIHAVVDAALLIYWEYHTKVDTTILVTATADRRRQRMAGRGLSADEFRARTKSQLSESYLKKNADIILANNNTLDSLRRRAEKLYRELTEKG